MKYWRIGFRDKSSLLGIFLNKILNIEILESWSMESHSEPKVVLLEDFPRGPNRPRGLFQPGLAPKLNKQTGTWSPAEFIQADFLTAHSSIYCKNYLAVHEEGGWGSVKTNHPVYLLYQTCAHADSMNI